MTTDAALGVTRFGLSPELAADLAASGVEFESLTGAALLTILGDRRRAARPKRQVTPRVPDGAPVKRLTESPPPRVRGARPVDGDGADAPGQRSVWVDLLRPGRIAAA